MSSPRQNTFWSRSISSMSASRIASRYVTSDIMRPPARRTLVHFHRRLYSFTEPQRRKSWRIRVDSDQRIAGLRHRRRFRLIRRTIDLFLDARVDCRQLRLLEAFVEQSLHIAIDRIVLRGPAVDLPCRNVRLVVVLGVSFSPVRHEL